MKNIKKRLDRLGYYTYITPAYLVVARDSGYDEATTKYIDIDDFFCAVHKKEKQIKVTYNFANISDEAFFDSESEVVRFIKKQFPV